MNSPRPLLDRKVFRAVCDHAAAHAILPDDAVRITAGLRTRERFLVDLSHLSSSFSYGQRYLSVLSALYLGDKKAFNAAARKVNGKGPRYFARSAEELESAGHSNGAAVVPDTPWFAIIQNRRRDRVEIVRQVMTRMGGFSVDYIHMVSRLCLRQRPELPGAYARTLARFAKSK